ncbi:MAG: PDZ domain-containing protein [Bacteroidales bacterium]|jgi:carboxyl-terminal processing protease|nr:PDZ domain-containing protein [Bacteroidales bacterium]
MQTENKDPYYKIRLPIYLSLVFSVGFLIGIYCVPLRQQIPLIRIHSGKDKAGEVSDIINRYYFEDINQKQLDEEAIRGMLLNLDPHSSYMTKEETEQANTILMGGFEGIGIQFNMHADTLWVVSVTSGGPSEKVGILPGDRIIKVNGELIAGVKMQNTSIVQLLRGKKGTKVQVDILRKGVRGLISFEIVRDKIPVYSIPVYYEIAPKTGYINIDNFTLSTADEFHAALQELIRQGVDKLILDLRGNPGGYLGAAIAICDELLPEDELIVYTYGKAVGKQEYYSTSGGLFEKNTQKIVVLTDEYSASASEIVAGAIQDHDRGLVIGRRSFGKGLVQRQFYLSDSSEVLITVARYYTPTGRCIQRPFDKTNNDDYYADILTRYERGEMDSKDSIHFADSLRFITPGGKTVYGGGGIMPDIFIPIEKSDSVIYFNRIANQGIVYSYAMEYVDKNRNYLTKTYKTVHSFLNSFTVSSVMISEMMSKGREQGIVPENSAYSVKEFKKWTKAYIGRNLFGEKSFYSVINADDEMIKRAINELKIEN